MPSVDNRIVEMQFKNKQFNNGVDESIDALDRLKSALSFKGLEDSFSSIEKAINHISFDGLTDGVLTIANRFSTLGIIGTTILRNLANEAYAMGKKVVTAIPQQIVSGGKARALNIEQAKFQLQGLGVAWEDIYDNIDKAVAGTAYGLDEAAKVAAQLVASSVAYGDAESDMAHALRGISGVAAMTNSSYSEIGNIFTTVASNGKLMTMQLRQFSARGLNVTAVLAKQLNKTEAQIAEMVTKGQIDFVTFANAMDEAFGEHATKANETFTGAFSNMKAALSRIGADFATPILDGSRAIFNSLRTTFNDVRKLTRPYAENGFTSIFNEAIDFVVDKIEKLDISDLTHFVKAADNGFRALLNIIEELSPAVSMLKETWNSLFPRSVGELIEGVSEKLLSLSESFKLGSFLIGRNSDLVKNQIEGLGTVWQDVFGQIETWKDNGNKTSGEGLTILQRTITGILNIVFEAKEAFLEIVDLFAPLLEYIDPLIEAITTFFSSFQKGSKNLNNVKDIFKGFTSVLKLGLTIFYGFLDVLKPLTTAIQPIVEKVLEFSASVARFITSLVEGMTKSEAIGKIFRTIGGIILGVFGIVFGTIQRVVNVISLVFDKFLGFPLIETV